jgi:DNA-binding PucR family transcriptional regulator
MVLRKTLRAYFAAGFNAATAAAALEIDRHTVQRRLRKVEESLGRLLDSCHAELAVALRLEELDGPAVRHYGDVSAPERTTLV